ncbi:MAG: protoheme IX farnesyltransferase [Verrucomicrobia bacterium]|nr:protoheme IX farnesyltransferase [Verrucomicrobiota bacterium]
MEKTSTPTFSFTARNYSLLTKPGIIFGNVVTTAGGFALASKGSFNLWAFLATLLGITLVIASACVFNNYIDRHSDKKMNRTKNRPLVLGLISTKSALFFGLILGLAGAACLYIFVNTLATLLAIAGFLVYVIFYSLSKYYTIHGTLIGSISGALPPLVGYCAASSQLDLAAAILFVTVAFWQMPHFFAIGIFRLDDYKAAGIPIVPIKRGMKATKIQMILYIFAFAVSASLLTVFGYTNYVFAIVSSLLSLFWLFLGFQGFSATDDQLWARKMFKFSLIVILGVCFAIPFTTI